MENNHEKIILGIIFILAGVFYFFNIPYLSKFDEFCFTLSAFFLSITSLFNEPLNKGKFSTFKFLKILMYFLGFFCLFLLPQFEKNDTIVKISTTINSMAFLMFGFGITFISMFFNEKDNNQMLKNMEHEKHEAVLNERKKITDELYRRINKDK